MAAASTDRFSSSSFVACYSNERWHERSAFGPPNDQDRPRKRPIVADGGARFLVSGLKRTTVPSQVWSRALRAAQDSS